VTSVGLHPQSRYYELVFVVGIRRCVHKKGAQPDPIPPKVKTVANKHDPDERFSLDTEPEEALDAILEGAGVEEALPDIISDPGVEGGVDAPNEEPDEPEEPETEV
jgi:hypothetical protein